jgi:putative membrane protein
LAFIAGGLAVGSLLPRLSVPGGRRAVAIALVLAGASVAVGGYLRWRNAEAALRADRPLPRTRLPLLVTAAVVLAAVVTAATALAAA